jgi:hypothetical protein
MRSVAVTQIKDNENRGKHAFCEGPRAAVVFDHPEGVAVQLHVVPHHRHVVERQCGPLSLPVRRTRSNGDAAIRASFMVRRIRAGTCFFGSLAVGRARPTSAAPQAVMREPACQVGDLHRVFPGESGG